MELIAAQDDARAAREETRRLKSELAVAEAARQEVRPCPTHLPVLIVAATGSQLMASIPLEL